MYSVNDFLALSIRQFITMDSKYNFDFEHKYEDATDETFTWIMSSTGECNLQGRVPARGMVVPVNLIDEETKIQRPGNFYAEELRGRINLFQMIDSKTRRTILKWPKPIAPKESFDELWDKYFESHENIKLLHDMIDEWAENEEYIEIDSSETHQSGSHGGNSSRKKQKRNVVKKPRLRTVKDKFYIAKGPIQGCKSKYMIDGALECLKLKKSSIIIFEETGHLIQFRERLDQEFGKIKKWFRTSGKPCKVPLTYVVAKDEKVSSDSFLESLQGKPAKIFLIIGNDKQAGLLNQKFENATRKVQEEIMESYVLWIDEADYIDSGTKAKKTGSLNTLKKYSYATIEVSATVLDITGREDVSQDHLHLLKAPNSYRGILSFDTSNLTEEEAKYTDKTSANLLKTDKALKRLIYEFVNIESPTWCAVRNDSHPCIMLINNCKTKAPQKRLLTNLKYKYSDLVVMVYIGDGLYIYHRRLPSDPFEINNIKSSITSYGHLFKGISPSAALLWLKRNGGVRIFHHILIVSGNLAGRSISYGCKDDKAKNGFDFWHLTHHRLVLPQNSACPSVIQKCRLCTTFESNIPLKLYVNKKDEQAIIKSYWSQEEIIARSKANPDEQYLRQIMAQLELLGGKNGKIPTGRTLTIDRKLKVCKKVKGDDGGLSISSYKFDSLLDLENNIIKQIEEDVTERKEIEQKEMQHGEEGSIILVDPRNMERNITRGYIERMIKGFVNEQTGLGTGKWVTKASLIRHIEKNSSAQTAITNATWNVHDGGSGKKVSSETTPGLVFKLQQNTWHVRYND
jgi:hypothetical protein